MMATIKKQNFITFITTLALTMYSFNVFATVTPATSLQYAHTPPAITSTGGTSPLVMLVMSNDHQLFTKAYTDYNDIIDTTSSPAKPGTDGVIETTYTDAFDYYGYFNSKRCYDYSSGKFTPTANSGGGTNSHDCANSEWSGNFLNWSTMTKMDVIRKVLYGGYRSTDDATTVLERAFVPKDAHAFVKTFTAASVAEMRKYTPYNATSISLCNVSHGTSGNSHSTVGLALAPKIRVANGTWDRWSSSEVAQCEWSDDSGANNSMGNLPQSGLANDELGTYNARVEVCVSGREESNCTSYTDSGTGVVSKKPTGLLQQYGENDTILFGLISGSYVENNSGGILRKNISSIQNEINSDNGRFTSVQGIINTISAFRITSYDSGLKKYNDCNTHSISVSDFLTSTSSGRQCQNWGNPIGEMYLEALRYFSGSTTASTDFSADDSGLINTTNGFGVTLSPVSWSDPLSAANYCAKCNIIVISSGLNSFDMDELSSASDIPGLTGAADVIAKTNLLNATEAITGNYFIGINGTDNNGSCTAKDLTSILGYAAGICPEEPYALGGFGVAGLSYHGHTTDMRPSNGTFPGNQKVNTFVAALSRGLPSFTIPTSGNSITIMPSCQANTNGSAGAASAGWNQCSLVDLQVLNATYSSNKIVSGTVRIHFEDSHWGNDYDMDGVQDLSFCVGTSCSPAISTDQVKVTVTSPTAAAGNALRFGYTIGGTTNDGEKFPLIRPGGQNYNSIAPGVGTVRDCSQAPVNDVNACTTIYTAGTSNIGTLKAPLWYAAKWGGFTDLNGNNLPDLADEWDSVNNETNASGPDGIPDNYNQSDNPAALAAQLNKVFSSISKRRSAGSAAAVITNTVTSTAMMVQGLYQPEIKSPDQTQTIQWGGYLHTLLLDKELNFREDSNQNGQIDDYATDKVIQFFYDTSQNRTRIQRFNTSDGITLTASSVADLEDLKTLWDARKELNNLNSGVLTSNRTYTDANNLSTNANSQRYIFTWLDADNDGVVDSGEQTGFLDSSFSNSNYGYFNLQADKDGDADIDLADAQRLVNFIRGVDYSTLRNRTIDSDGDGTNEVWRLGDIIHSTPIVVEKPVGIWRTQYGDTTYDTFVNQYKKRRSMVYVGGNDGLLHAFNSGFLDTAIKKYNLTRAAESFESAAPASHKLGAEIWAYAPKNLLPHLQWLSEVNYPNHVYFVDGEIKTFDVNIFPDDTDHPNGWGTILVSTMRFGGGADDASNASSLDIDVDGDATTDFKARSSVIIMDITNPEAPPKLLAEYNDTNLGLTTSTPELVVFRQPNAADGDWTNPSVNDWYLVFGSGPTDITTLLSTQTPSVYVLKLNNVDLGTIEVTKKTLATANSYIGKIHTVDWTNNFITDNLYFGVSGGTALSPNGYLARMGSALTESDSGYYDIDTNNWAISTVINPAQPFFSKPTTMRSNGKNWVFAGSGRRLVTSDDSIIPTQSYYGIKESLSATNGLPDFVTDTNGGQASVSRGASTTTLTGTELQNVTGLQVFTNYSVLDPSTSLPTGSGITTFSQLESYMNGVRGWYRDWSPASNLKERVNADTQTLTQQLLITTFQPAVDPCKASGATNFYSLYNITGTAHPGAGIGENTSITNSGSSLVTDHSTVNGENFGNLVCIGAKCAIIIQGSGDGGGDKDGDGIADDIDTSDSSVAAGSGGNCTTADGGACASGVTQTPLAQGRQSWREIYLEEEF